MHKIYSLMKGFVAFVFMFKDFHEDMDYQILADDFWGGDSYGNGDAGTNFDGNGFVNEEDFVFPSAGFVDYEDQ